VKPTLAVVLLADLCRPRAFKSDGAGKQSDLQMAETVIHRGRLVEYFAQGVEDTPPTKLFLHFWVGRRVPKFRFLRFLTAPVAIGCKASILTNI
jgi:hypothetical protein